MKQLLAGFIDVWKVLVVDSFRSEGEPWINLFDLGVFIGIASMLAIVGGTITLLAQIF
jgi:purine nucleoside permease